MIPVDFYDTIDHLWKTICDEHDVSTALPDFHVLFEGVDLSDPERAAEKLIANMLAEVVECVGRFSPWYRRPDSAFGLIGDYNATTSRTEWRLTADAVRARQTVLNRLQAAIERNVGLILATQTLDDLETEIVPDDPCIKASCKCKPPRSILVNRSVLAQADIVCDVCQQRFQLAEAP